MRPVSVSWPRKWPSTSSIAWGSLPAAARKLQARLVGRRLLRAAVGERAALRRLRRRPSRSRRSACGTPPTAAAAAPEHADRRDARWRPAAPGRGGPGGRRSRWPSSWAMTARSWSIESSSVRSPVWTKMFCPPATKAFGSRSFDDVDVDRRRADRRRAQERLGDPPERVSISASRIRVAPPPVPAAATRDDHRQHARNSAQSRSLRRTRAAYGADPRRRKAGRRRSPDRDAPAVSSRWAAA